MRLSFVKALIVVALLAIATGASAQGSTSTSPGVVACPLRAIINLTASAQVITGVAGQKIYICAIVLSLGATANSVNVVEGTGAVCATGTVGFLGGTTAALGLTIPINTTVPMVADRPWLTSAAGANVCVLKSAAGQLSGVIAYRLAP